MAKLKFSKRSKENIDNGYRWKILIVDDEPEIHKVTKTVLKNIEFESKKLEFFSAYNAHEAIDILKNNYDIAIVFLDVVMESDDAGLKVAKQIRNELHNKNIRIILRTGQPGLAPEHEIILNYDINDYKSKTELTSDKLFTTVIAALRAYKDLIIIDKNRIGLEKIIDASKSIFKLSSLNTFVEGVLTQLISILNLSDDVNNIRKSDAFFAQLNNSKFELIATTGKFKMDDNYKIITPKAIEYLDMAFIQKSSFFKDDVYVGYFEATNNSMVFLYIEGCKDLNDYDKKFLRIFSHNISIAYENIHLNAEIIDTQKEIVEILGEVVENRSKDTANHVKRVANISYILAIAYGLSKKEAQELKLASPMHDIGKIAIPDNILLKPQKLDENELKLMQTHSSVGYEILKNSKRNILKTAAIVAYEHHEKWDGTGYPRGLKGKDINIYGRITSLVDVFDALLHKRAYKDAWELKEVLKYIKDQKGLMFEPKIVDCFFENLDEIKKISGIK